MTPTDELHEVRGRLQEALLDVDGLVSRVCELEATLDRVGRQLEELKATRYELTDAGREALFLERNVLEVVDA